MPARVARSGSEYEDTIPALRYIEFQRDLQPPRSALIVDADESIRELLQSVLEVGGFEVRAVDDGEHAIAELEAHRPDLLITNLALQNMSGNELMGYVRADRTLAGIPIMVVSGHLDVIRLDHEPDGVIHKPFDAQELLACARQLVDRSADAA
ncbi:MAG TPA: response regulator [Candidatus Dormibacteraeota bacterium]|nr:response regulator [Candidatus Dormibacteraeota bacterium]